MISRRLHPVFSLLFVLALLLATLTHAEYVAGRTFFIDFADGNDANDGLSKAEAWKHCSGDSNARGVPATTLLQPGDKLLFKGGVAYRGAIKCSASGSPGLAIVYDGNLSGGWGNGEAIIDGTAPLTGWALCASQNDLQGNPDWQHIFYADTDAPPNPARLFLLEDREPLWAAQFPRPPDRFFWDNTEHYFQIPPDQISATSLVDMIQLPSQPGDFWHGAYISLWHQPNLVSLARITQFDSVQSRIEFDRVGTPYPDRSNRYAIVNSPMHISGPGEYAVVPNPSGATASRVFLWPRDHTAPTEGRISLSVSEYGIDINRKSHITVQGFRVVGVSGTTLRGGIGIGCFTTGIEVTNITIRANTVQHTRSSHGKGYGGINLDRGIECSIVSNTIHEVQRHTGIFITGGRGSTVSANTVSRPGYVGIWGLGSQSLIISHNSVTGALGTHANGISAYSGCDDVMVYGNLIKECDLPLTLSTSRNLTVIDNLIIGNSKSSKLLALWGGCEGKVSILNNTIVGSNNRVAVYWADSIQAEVVFRNNIIDGGGGGVRSHNIYVGLTWNQTARFGWALAEGELVVTDLNSIFLAPQAGNFRLRPGSPAIDAGFELPQVTHDHIGTQRPQGAGWDIGAYEFVPFPAPADGLR